MTTYYGKLKYEFLGLNTWQSREVELYQHELCQIYIEAIILLEEEKRPIRNIKLEIHADLHEPPKVYRATLKYKEFHRGIWEEITTTITELNPDQLYISAITALQLLDKPVKDIQFILEDFEDDGGELECMINPSKA